MNTSSVVGWTPEPQIRGTVGLLWGCLATIFLCTWNAVHVNLPGRNETAWHVFWRRVVYMFNALMAPELVCVLALGDHWHARAVQAKSPGWSLAQSFFLIMGGFVVQHGDETLCLCHEDMLELFTTNTLRWPEASLEPQIRDRSKSDGAVKALALLQATWFVAQVVGRAAQGLPTTTLELFTLGMISCTLCTYIAWWDKPFDVREPVILELSKESVIPGRMKSCGRIDLMYEQGNFRASSRTGMSITVGITLLFGALHLVGWGFFFPTEMERWLWRGSSVACTIMPLLMLSLNYKEWWDRCGEFVEEWLMTVMVWLYVVCRVYMLVEMFLSLRAVPADVYRTPQWSQYLPSFG
ncbi:hypothetical protein C7974DRAFT_221926 [Boeremia exigua]|uniref:uncharacterized protein n=1 Tax=Boeremia exigua TaxID=749465 RepID=UPI001E8E7E92|nr:uncharacterized protein C7974DRAFT_221926 [Boeremia exigua]KAH6622410.1 hypothetical protein C7974DRAFT_221926 [Boeremia exigua]